MTLEQLLKLADLGAAGTQPGAPVVRASVPAPRIDPAQALDRVRPELGPPESPFGSMQDVSGMAPPDTLERIAASRFGTSDIGRLVDMVGTVLRGGHSGFADARNRAALNLESERLTQSHTEARKAAQKAKEAADAENRKARIAEVKAARDKALAQVDAIGIALAGASTPEQSDALKRLARQHSDKAKELDGVLAKLTGNDALMGAGIDVSGLPDAPKPPAEKTADQGSFVTVQTPDGPKMMRQAEAAAKGYTEADARKIKPPTAGERDALTNDIGMVTQINRVREKYRPEFVGLGKGRLGPIDIAGTQEALGGMSREESSFRSSLAAIRNQILKLRSGGAVTEGEASRLLEEMPTVGDPPNAWAAKMEQFESTFRTIAETRRENLSGTGVDISKTPPLPPKWTPKKKGAATPKASGLPPGARRVN